MKRYLLYGLAFVASTALTLTSCLDYDVPSDEFSQTEIKVDDTIYHGAADSIGYTHVPTVEGLEAALTALNTPLRQAKGGIYAMRGGKEGNIPVSHSYQRQYTLGPDNYAQFAVVPHYDFMYGTLSHIYAVSKEFNPGPFSCFGIAKNAFVPVLNRPEIDSIPELKATYLLLYNYVSQEVADLYGPFPYVDYKANKTDAPFTYNDLRTIYVNIEANVDTILACYAHFESKPDWYKQKVKEQMYNNFGELNLQFDNMDTWIRFANSFKLRLGMHVVKVDPALAQKWAEEAVAGGVIESVEGEIALAPFMSGFSHPLMDISETWGDTRLSASFESLLISLNHPYANYLFLKNGNVLIDSKKGTSLKANSRLVGMREGIEPGYGQSYSTNQFIAFSRINPETLGAWGVPLYLMKLSEVDFLRAEGALRGWAMGGDAATFYNRGIDYAYLEWRDLGPNEYTENLAAYKSLAHPVAYTYVDPTGNSDDIESVTKIGVKWDESDSREVKLEKIITQKYIAAYPYSYEPWVDMRRTGYPKLFPVLNPQNGDGSLKAGDIIRRMPFANTDDASIEDIQNTGLSALGGPDLQATRLWWDVDAANF
jgi:hypothetical protein